MDLAGRNEDMDAMAVRSLDGLVDLFDVVWVAAGQTTDDRAQVFLGDRLYRFEVSR